MRSPEYPAPEPILIVRIEGPLTVPRDLDPI
jgi:hypothetical protein